MNDKQQEEPDFDAIRAEMAAMGQAYEAFAPLDRPSQLRAMRWLNDRLQDDARQAAGDDEEPF